MGAAVATLLSYLVMAGMLFVMVQRIYPVRYEWKRLAKIACAAGCVIAGGLLVQQYPLALGLKTVLLVLFPVALYAMRFFVPGEVRVMAQLVRGIGLFRTRPATPNGPE
jgi:hypothetical protein